MSLISVTGPDRLVLDDLTARVDGLETGSVAGWKGPYTDTAAGLAATAAGEVFYTADSNGIVLYRNDSGAATELTSMVGQRLSWSALHSGQYVCTRPGVSG